MENQVCLCWGIESTRNRLESTLPRNHREHIAEKGFNLHIIIWCINSFLCSKRWKFRMRKLQWRDWDKLEKVFAWQMEKVVSKRHVNLEAQKERQNESPLCYIDGHVSSPECRVRTKAPKVQRLSRATMHVRHSQNKDRQPREWFFQIDVFARLPGCGGQAADAVSAYAQVKMKDARRLLKIPKSECPDIWIRLPRRKWPKSWSNIEDSVVSLERNLYGQFACWLLVGKTFEEVLLKLGWRKCTTLRVSVSSSETFSNQKTGWQNGLKKKKMHSMWKQWMKNVDIDEPTSILDHLYLGRTQDVRSFTQKLSRGPTTWKDVRKSA